jgi:hypothetical protein
MVVGIDCHASDRDVIETVAIHVAYAGRSSVFVIDGPTIEHYVWSRVKRSASEVDVRMGSWSNPRRRLISLAPDHEVTEAVAVDVADHGDAHPKLLEGVIVRDH